MDPTMGMLTKIWGPGAWILFHCIAFNYPLQPTKEQKQQYKIFFKYIGYVLPCKYCRDSYQKFIKEPGTKLNYSVLKNRDTLSRWAYRIHNKVNKKLGMNYDVSYSNVKKRYETYRAKCTKSIEPHHTTGSNTFGSIGIGCTVPLNYKALSFGEFERKDCPIVKYDTIKRFIPLGKKLGLPDRDFQFLKLVQQYNGNICMIKQKHSMQWNRRNQLCQRIIWNMRKRNTKSIINNYPTKNELRLLLHLCSNLSEKQVQQLSS